MSGRFRHCALILALAMASVLPTPAAAAPERDFAKKMNEALTQAAAAFGDAGVQAVALRNGRVLWSGTRGAAINEPRQPVTEGTMFAYASLSKLMLTTFVLHQVEQGALALDKPISAYVGDEVAGSRVVNLRMLLTHTSGYPDLYSDPATAPLFPPSAKYDPNRPYTFEQLKAGIREPVEPGARFAYSNTGYIVLGHVLTRTTGGDHGLRRAYQHFLQRAGTRQTPMTEHLVTMDRSPQALHRFAHGYSRQEDGSLQDFFTAYGAKGIPTDLYGLPFTDGALAGTALGAGLVLDAVFARGNLLRPDTVRRMTTPSPQSAANPDGDRTYGMGTSRTKSGGRTWQGHGGSYIGFTSMAGTDMARGVTIAVVVNRFQSQHPAETIWRKLTEVA
ncbi:beta-lactamase family protein [Crossiella sp. SN42]|uniref:serine hydrolase domain-containing protein n=1 Tax=Crossiella sp. SN42 TaxID=2944808 RepID=UPI00207C1EA2|nr:serine hydrolase domain-containing protein [Crossiella sp. SN42]MCO1574302.1 beta-lactamase family protein [Crossiella sp. SN42]